MISDVLFEAVREIDAYLKDKVFADVYGGSLRARIIRCRTEMDTIRQILDTPPNVARAGESAGAGNAQGGAAQ